MTQTEMNNRAMPGPFLVRDCALMALAMGKKTRLLQTFRQMLAGIDPYFGNLHELRDQLGRVFSEYFNEAAL